MGFTGSDITAWVLFLGHCSWWPSTRVASAANPGTKDMHRRQRTADFKAPPTSQTPILRYGIIRSILTRWPNHPLSIIPLFHPRSNVTPAGLPSSAAMELPHTETAHLTGMLVTQNHTLARSRTTTRKKMRLSPAKTSQSQSPTYSKHVKINKSKPRPVLPLIATRLWRSTSYLAHSIVRSSVSSHRPTDSGLTGSKPLAVMGG